MLVPAVWGAFMNIHLSPRSPTLTQSSSTHCRMAQSYRIWNRMVATGIVVPTLAAGKSLPSDHFLYVSRSSPSSTVFRSTRRGCAKYLKTQSSLGKLCDGCRLNSVQAVQTVLSRSRFGNPKRQTLDPGPRRSRTNSYPRDAKLGTGLPGAALTRARSAGLRRAPLLDIFYPSMTSSHDPVRRAGVSDGFVGAL